MKLRIGPTPNDRCRLVSVSDSLEDQASRASRARPSAVRPGETTQRSPQRKIFIQSWCKGESSRSGVDRQHGGDTLSLLSNAFRRSDGRTTYTIVVLYRSLYGHCPARLRVRERKRQLIKLI